MNKNQSHDSAKKTAANVSAAGIAANSTLAAIKLLAGIISGSSAMISDAVNSLSDVVTTVIVIVGVNLSYRSSDSRHPYGHERFESVTSMIVAAILAVTGFAVEYGAIISIIGKSYLDSDIPGTPAIIAAVISIAVKEFLAVYTRCAAKKLNLSALMASARDHQADVLSTLGALIGILFARHGYPVMDCAASIVIGLFILKSAIDVFRDASVRLVDASCDSETVEEIRKTVSAQEGVIAVDDIKTRLFGAKIFAEIEISADRSISLDEAHNIADRVHDSVEQAFPQCKHCMVHVNPAKD